MGRTARRYILRVAGSRPLLRIGAVALGALLPVLAPAQSLENAVTRNSFNPVGSGARGTGMGGAFIAVADDGTAASFNPAGLTQLRRPELAVVTFGSALSLTTNGGYGLWQPPNQKASHIVPEFVGFAIPWTFRGRQATLQLSYQRAVDLFGRGSAAGNLDIPPEAIPERLRSLAAEPTFFVSVGGQQKGALHTVTLSAAREVSDRLSVGVALNTWIGEWQATGTRLGDYYVDAPSQPRIPAPDFVHAFTQQHHLRGTSFNLGLLYRHSRIALGGVLRLPFGPGYRLEEQGRVPMLFGEVVTESERLKSGRMNTTLRWPPGAGIGVAYHPVRGLTLVGDYTRTMWSRTVIEGLPNGALLTTSFRDQQGVIQAANVYFDRNFFDLYPASQSYVKDCGAWRGGVEYLLNLPHLVVPLRAGVFQDRSPIPDLRTLESRRINGITLGTGVSFDHVVFDVAFERRTTGGAIGVAVADAWYRPTGTLATEATVHRRLVASLILRFGRTAVGTSRREERPRR